MHSFSRNKYILYCDFFCERNIKIYNLYDSLFNISLDISARKGKPILS